MFSFQVFPFNPEKCKENFFVPKFDKDKGIPSKIISSTSNATVLLSDATTIPLAMSETMSSTGFCAGTNPDEQEKLEFFKKNYEPLKIEIAKGHGDFLDSFITLFKCDDSLRVKKQLKEDFSAIYSEKERMEENFRNIQLSVRNASSQNCSNAVTSP